MISKTFFKSSLIYSVVGTLPYVSGVILIPFFTSQLTAEQFGINALYFGMLGIFQVLAGVGMDSFIGVYYYEFKDNARKLRELIGTILFFSLVIGALLVTLGSIGGPSAFKLLWPNETALSFYPYGLFTLLTAIFSAGFKSYTSLLINQQRVSRFFWMNILNFILTITISLLLLYAFPYTLTGPILGRLLPMALSFILCIVMMIGEFGFRVRMELFKPLLDFCLPIFIYSGLIWIVNNIDRFIIFHFMPNASYVGIFDIAVKITLFLEIFQIGLINTIQPKVFSIWKETKLNSSSIEVNRYYNGFIAITMLLTPIILLVFPVLVPLVIKKPVYYEALIYLPILSLGYVTRGWFFMFTAPIYYFKKTKVLPKVFFISAIIQIFGTMYLISRFGIMGAVWANFLIKPLQAVLLYNESRKVFKFSFNRWKIIYLPILFIVTGIACELVSTPETRVTIQLGQFFLTLGLVSFIYRNELMPMIRKWVKP